MTPVEQSVLETLAYFDQFDRALTIPELYEFSSIPAFESSITAAVQSLEKNKKVISESYIGLRQVSVQATIKRQKLLMKRRKQGLEMAEMIYRVPGIVSVIVQNSLALQTAHEESDIDFLILVEPGTLYFARTVALARLKSRGLAKSKHIQAGKACLGYWLDIDHLELEQYQTAPLTGAYWLASMVPLAGIDGYQKLMEENNWIKDYVPNQQEHHVAHIPPKESHSAYWTRPLDQILYPLHKAKVRLDPAFRNSSEALCGRHILKLHSYDSRPGYVQNMQTVLEKLAEM